MPARYTVVHVLCVFSLLATLVPPVPAAAAPETPPPPPVVTSPSAPVALNGASYTIRGTSMVNTLVEVYADANRNGKKDRTEKKPVGSQQLADGATEFAISVPLARNATNHFVAIARLASGLESESTAVPPISEDSTPPSFSAVSASPGPFSPNGDGAKDQASIGFTLSEAAAVTLELFDGTNARMRTLLAADSRAAGSHTVAWDGRDGAAAVVPDGTYTYRLDAVDAVGNAATQATGTLRVDTTAPVLSAVSDAPDPFSPNGDGTKDGTVISYVLSEAAAVTVRVYDAAQTLIRTLLADGSRAPGAHTESWDGRDQAGTAVADGSYGYRVEATDAAANVATPQSGSVAVDATAPTAEISVPASGALTNSRALAATAVDGSTGSGVAGVLFQTSADGATWADVGPADTTAPYEGTLPSSLADGAYQVRAVATDQAGNTGTSAAVAFSLDTTPPAAPSGLAAIDRPADAGGALDLTWMVSASVDVAGQQLHRATAAGGPYTLVSSFPDNTTAAYTDTGLADGTTYYYVLRATDRAGNQSAPSDEASAAPAVNDTTAPAPPVVTDPAAPLTVSTASYTLQGTAEADALVRVYADANANGLRDPDETAVLGSQQLSGGATAFAISVSLTLSAVNRFLVTATDGFTNESAATAAPAITHQAAAPETTITSGPADPTTSTVASFGFSSSDPEATFECALDGAAFGACTSPQEYTGLGIGTHTFQVRAKDTAGTTDPTPAGFTWTIEAADVDLPPDPSTVAPPIDATVVTDLLTASAFLYTGSNPIQTGVAPGTIESRRVSVLRGAVHTRDGQPLPGVTITILGHPEFGQTLSRADGAFDLAVNGGGPLTVDYQKPGYLPAQRQVQTSWQDYGFLPDVVLIPLDPQVTSIDLASTAAMQVARGSIVSDADGNRQATLLFPQGTTATLALPDGSTQPLTTLRVRATEYTVGPSGPNAMPAELPPTSAYTYAVELSVDEALAAGATQVHFSTPLPFYVENFLSFPAGTIVPLGGYDRARGVWVPEESGKVVAIVSVTNGLADIDADGDGPADDAAALAALGITDAERQQLAALYAPGQSLWRVRVPHFSPWDLNWGFGPPSDAVAPGEDPEPDEPLSCPATEAGSVIECQNQVLGEGLGLVGTPFGLHYLSDRTPGYKAAYVLDIPLSGSTVPASLRQIELEIRIAGRLFQQSFGPAPNQRTTFTWDGKDAYGRTLQGSQPVTVRIGYTYGAAYGSPLSFGASALGAIITGSRARQEVTIWRDWLGKLGAWDARAAGLGGWTLSAHHAYDPADGALHRGGVLYRGDGARQSTRDLGPTIRTVAGTGLPCNHRDDFASCGDGGPATQAKVTPRGLAFGPDGSLYIADGDRVRRVGPDGVIRNVAGAGGICSLGPCGDGGLATQAYLSGAYAVAVAADGSFYIGQGNPRVRKVGPDGIITTFAGTGESGFSGDGGPATQAQLASVTSLALGPDGSLYITDTGNNRIRRVGPDGIITTVAGSGALCFAGSPTGDGGPATQARLCGPRGVAIGRDGSLYIADQSNERVRRVTPDGIIRTIAGSGVQGFAGDGGPATQARFTLPSTVAVGPDDTVYVGDSGNNRVRWFRPGGTINTLAGTGVRATSGDGGPASRAALMYLDFGLAVGPDSGVYFSQSSDNYRVRRVEPISARVLAGGLLVPAEDGSEVYLFDGSGRHLQTLDALTAAVRYQFAYDGAGRLASVTDGDGNVTTIERDADGSPTAIAGPFGQRTTLTLDTGGYLGRLTNPAGEAAQLAYTAEGLLTGFTSPRGHSSSYTYDALGRLTSATDPTGATKTLARSGTTRDHTVTLTDALGRATAYRVERLSTGALQLTVTDPAGAQTRVVAGKDGTYTATYPDGTRVTLVLGPDPRWRMQAPVATSLTVTTPGGTAQTATQQRTVTLASPTDLLSLRTFTETATINGRVYSNAYDATTRTLTRTSPGGRRDSIVVDALGRTVQEQPAGLDPISYTYDSQGRLTTVTQGSGSSSRVTHFAYGSTGFLASVTDAAGRITTFANDAAGRVTEQTLPGGRVARYTYDANGNVTGVTPPGRAEHTFGYSPIDQISAYTAPAAGGGNGQIGYTYAADRQLQRVDRADGQAVGLQYDAAGRLNRVSLGSGDLTYTYDAAGRLASLRTPTVSLAHSYDGSLLTDASWSGGIAGSVRRTYDNNFWVTGLSVNGGTPIAIQYDAAGLATGLGALGLTRDVQSGLIVASSLGVNTDAVSYDGFGAPSQYIASANGSAIYSVNYTRDSIGRLASATETTDGVTRVFGYSYDPAGRLVEVRQGGAPVASYAYDANGNRVSRSDPGGTVSATYDAQDRLLQQGATTYAYTPNGELQAKTTGSQTTTYQYDMLGNLTGVTLPSGTAIEYLLDAQGRRVGKRVNGTLVQGFLYLDDLRPIAELDGSGAVVSTFVYVGRSASPAYMIKGGVTYRVVTNAQGSPRLVVDAATGAIVQRLDYDAFGMVTQDTNPGFQPFGFAGGLFDRQTGLVHFGAREYDPEAGRWTSKDPIGFGGGDPNLYGYVFGDPVNGVDPSGLFCESGPTCAMLRDDNSLLNGEITQQEYRDRQIARSVGGMIGTGIVLGAIGIKATVSALGSWLLSRWVACRTAGGAGGRVATTGEAAGGAAGGAAASRADTVVDDMAETNAYIRYAYDSASDLLREGVKRVVEAGAQGSQGWRDMFGRGRRR